MRGQTSRALWALLPRSAWERDISTLHVAANAFTYGLVTLRIGPKLHGMAAVLRPDIVFPRRAWQQGHFAYSFSASSCFSVITGISPPAPPPAAIDIASVSLFSGS